MQDLDFNEYLTTVGQFPNTFSPEECRRLIELPLPAAEALVEVRNQGDPLSTEVNQLVYGSRRTRIKPIPPDPANEWVFRRLGELGRRVNEQAFHFRISDTMSVDVLEYGLDGFFDWHVDIGPKIFSTRKLTLVTSLTGPDDYQGGDLLFADGGGPIRLKQGTTAIFPSYLLHKVEPVTQGTRYTLVAWIHGPSFN
ncbi:MAG: 2OG-Fe(II) oxygenase [Gammaproteobacteria bacterium]|nr:2OG-Fe(II) oxygenase [Gammaproteobacteria bacterium]